MKTSFYLPVVLLLFVVSCEKEPDQKNAPENGTTVAERYFPEFTTYESRIDVGIGGHCAYGSESISQLFRYRLAPYGYHGDKYFYTYQERVEYKYAIGAHTSDWTETAGFYRYDFQNKVSYHYDDLDDNSPLLLMNFNLDSGESFLLDSSYYFQTAVRFQVTAKDSMIIDSYVFPVLKGHIVASGTDWNPDEHEIFVTPFHANPVWINHAFDFYRDHDWTPYNFAGYCAAYYHMHGFNYALWDMTSETKISNAGLFYW